MVWELMLCQSGVVVGTDLILIIEGKAEKTEVPYTEIGRGEMLIPQYATIEGRIEQHKGFLRVFTALEICKVNKELFRKMYINLCAKTMLLAIISINEYYSKIKNTDTLRIFESVFDYCMGEALYKTNISKNKNNYLEDSKIIKQSFENIKKLYFRRTV
jgi:hypothetical protein